MNKKGEMEQLGMILIVFITVLVGVILLVGSAQNVGEAINTFDVANESISNANGTTQAAIAQLQGKFVSDVVVYNATDDAIILSGNYTIFNNQVIDGAETAGVNISIAAAAAGGWDDGGIWQFSYTTQPTTYISDGGGRAVAGIIIIFFALAIIVVTLFPTVKNKALEAISGR